MNVADFIALFRQETGDTEDAYLWSDEEIVGYLNESANDAAERAFLIEDSTTADCCEITLVAGTNTYDLHGSVIRVKRATLAGKPMRLSSIEEMDDTGASWETMEGTPHTAIVNGQVTSVRVVPTPTEAGTLRLTVYRTPLEPLTVDFDTAEPELKPIYHRRLLDGMLMHAYRKHDADAKDEKLAIEHESRFARSFGNRPDANVQRKRADRRPPVVAFNRGW